MKTKKEIKQKKCHKCKYLPKLLKIFKNSKIYKKVIKITAIFLKIYLFSIKNRV